jgi:di/tricarboxylate transporter
METSTAIVVAVVLMIGLWLPYYFCTSAWESARTHLVHLVEARGHSDIGPDLGGPRQTRPGADDARGARY